jgi:uncharacterized repeat protein (TIGR01451 family)
MRFERLIFVIIMIAAVFTAFPVLAADKGSVAVELTGRKVVKDASGKEKFESAEKAKPGDIIEYRAVYRNKGKKPVTNVKGTIPVPQGTEYIAGSAVPSPVTASLDGKEYAPVPLKRQVKLPSGKEETMEVPYAEYRLIRWDLKTLAPGKNASVSMRVKISTELPSATK